MQTSLKLALPTFLFLPKKSKLPNFFGRGGGGGLQIGRMTVLLAFFDKDNASVLQ